jgi:hypothetical protein
MLLSYRIPLITSLILLLTAIVNIGAFQFFSERNFSLYLAELTESSKLLSPDPEKLKALLQIGKLDQTDQIEYLAILSELSNLTTSIENISKNPELYMSSRDSAGDAMILLPMNSEE